MANEKNTKTKNDGAANDAQATNPWQTFGGPAAFQQMFETFGADAWRDAVRSTMAEQVEQLDDAFEAYEAAQARARKQLAETIEQYTSEMKRLFDAQMDYVTKIQGEVHSQTVENARRAVGIA